MIEKHLGLIEEAGKKGVQILCLQEIFQRPTSAPPRTASGTRRPSRSPARRPSCIAEYAKKHQMVIVVPALRARRWPASTTTPPRSSTPTARTSASTARTTSRRSTGFWEKFFFKPGNLGYPVFETRYAKVGVYICYDRHFPEGARLLGLNGAEIVFNPSATVAGLSQYLWKLEQPAHAVANGYFIGAHQPRRHRAAVEHRRVLRARATSCNPRGKILAEGSEDKDELVVARPRPRHDRRGPQHLAVLPRPPARDLRGHRQASAVEEADMKTMARPKTEAGGSERAGSQGGQLRDTVLTDSFEISDGMIPVPEGHGLGVEVDRAKLEHRQPAM